MKQRDWYNIILTLMFSAGMICAIILFAMISYKLLIALKFSPLICKIFVGMVAFVGTVFTVKESIKLERIE